MQYDVDSLETSVCVECWLKVKSFHDFYLMVENVHNKFIPRIKEETIVDPHDETGEVEMITLDEVKVAFENEYHTINDDFNLDEIKQELHDDATNVWSEEELEIESHPNKKIGITSLPLTDESVQKMGQTKIPHRYIEQIM